MTDLVLFDDRATATETALTLPDGLDFDTWLAVGGPLLRAGSSIGWWVGDWILYATETYGQTTAGRALVYREITALSAMTPQQLSEARAVAAAIPPERRNPALSWSHHVLVARLDADEQRYWLERAAAGDGDGRWPVERLRRELGAARDLLAAATADPLPLPEDGERVPVLRPVAVPVAACQPRVVSALRMAVGGMRSRVPGDVWAALEGLLAAVAAATEEDT